MDAPNKEIHERIFDEIQARIESLQAGAPASAPGSGAWSQEEVATALAQLESDRDLLLAHWKTQDGASPVDMPPRCRACGETQACTQVREFKKKYCP